MQGVGHAAHPKREQQMEQFRAVIKVHCEKDIFTAEKDFHTLEDAQAWISKSLPEYSNIIEHYIEHNGDKLDVHDKFYMDVDYTKSTKRYELANSDYIYRLQRKLESMGIKTEAEEYHSYYNNFKLSAIYGISLVLQNTPVKYKNNGVGIDTYLDEDVPIPYMLSIWKYTGEHSSFVKEYKEINTAAIEEMAQLVADSFGYKTNNQPECEQLDMFSVLGV